MSSVKVVHLKGVLNTVQGSQLCQEVSELVAAGHTHVLIDCQDLEFVDSSGLGALVMSFQKIRETGGRMGLCSINDQLRMLLELTAMDKVLKVFSGVDAFRQSALS